MQNKTSIQRGFSLIELLIVVAIIGIIAAIAIPNLIASRRAANESSSISAMRLLHSAQVAYKTTAGLGEFAGTPGTDDISPLEQLNAVGLIDDLMATGFKSGYRYIGSRTLLSSPESATFYFAANPISTSGILLTGTKRFGVATDGIIKADFTLATLGTPFTAITVATAPPL